MATQKPISTISYNTEAFLLEKLNTWYKAHIIQAWQYIFHKGEDGDKDHFHVRLEPNKRIDPMDLLEELREFVIDNPKPLGCRPFRPSKEEDWFLYVVHDKDYLILKYKDGEKGEKLPYKWQDIKANDGYDTEVAFVRAKSHLEHTNASVAKRILKGDNALNLVLEGENPFQVQSILRLSKDIEYSSLKQAYGLLVDEHNKVMTALDNAGLTIVIIKGEYVIIPREVEDAPPNKSTAEASSNDGFIEDNSIPF